MSEDRLEKALQAMKSENVSPEDLKAAGARVWAKLGSPGTSLCSEFQSEFRAYLDGRLADSRRLLLEDHLGRCPVCRVKLAEERGESNVVAMPARRAARWPKWGAWVAAAAAILLMVYAGRDGIDSFFAPRGPRATVASLTGALHLVPDGVLQAGAPIWEKAVIRTGPGARAVLRLHDGSLVDMNERTELSVHAAWSGETIRLQRGDVIVRAAKQHYRHLRVETRDSIAAVKGTIFVVSAGLSGSVVSVVEGSVAVTQSDAQVLLTPGQQAASNPVLTSSVQQAVSWSPDAQTYLAVLSSLVQIRKQIAGLSSPLLHTQSALLGHMPADMVVYGAVPNFSGKIDQAVALAEQQSAENPAFNQWWNSGPGQEVRKLISRMQTVVPLLGDEIVYGICRSAAPTAQTIPILLAQVRSGKQAELEAALTSLMTGTGAAPKYKMRDTLLIATDSTTDLAWLLDHEGQGAGTPFAQDIAAHYQDGAAWLLGIDMESILAASRIGAAPPAVNPRQVKRLFFEQRNFQGAEENEMAVSFNGPRTGIASILASTGSGGAAEYLPGDSIAAVYASTREPQQLFDEIVTQLSRFSPMFQSQLAGAESKLGINFSHDLVRALGTESAFALEGLGTSGPQWMMAVLVNDSAAFDDTIRKLAAFINTALESQGKTERLSISQQVVDGRTWTTMKLAQQPFGITWTYDRGYLVAAADRGIAVRAIATRAGGSSLPWSAAFQQHLPASAGLHPSGFAWLNTQGTFQGLEALIPNPVIKELAAQRDPILVVFNGMTEQIRVLSRTRISGMVLDFMLMQGLGRTFGGTRPASP